MSKVPCGVMMLYGTRSDDEARKRLGILRLFLVVGKEEKEVDSNCNLTFALTSRPGVEKRVSNK